MNLIPSEKEVNVFQKYFKECVLLGLVSVVVYLFLLYKDLSTYIYKDMQSDKAILIKTLEQNTSAIQDFNKNIKRGENK